MKLIEQQEFRDRIRIFEDRHEAGRLLAEKLEGYSRSDAIILAIPSGGVPVASEMAKRLGLPADLIIVRKIQIPYNTEAGFGAVSPDGDVILNRPLLNRLALTDAEIGRQKSRAVKSISHRNRLFRDNKPYPDVKNKTVILVDDGIASGYTMLAAIRFVKKALPQKTLVAVPTASLRTAELILSHIDELVCLNVRTGFSFAVADAYRNWYDLDEEEVLSILKNPVFHYN